jgi:predicted HAD superfamily hydrolase
LKLASFDIFDTVLIRKGGSPESVFWLLAQQLYPNDALKCEAFFQWRLRAEDKIYRNTASTHYDSYSAEELMEREKQIEAACLIVNPEIRTLINDRRGAGYTICFISDMYLNSAFLSSILQREGCLEASEQVWVSCEQKARKSNGQLFEVVRRCYRPTEWIHYGDNRTSDVKIPRQKGIHAIKIDTAFNPAERLVRRKAETSAFRHEVGLFAGVSRACRLSFGNQPLITFAADLVAPAYMAYVADVLYKAKLKGIKHLYFLSRDSHILLKIAEVLNKGDLSLHYLYVSRSALLLPYLTETTPDRYLAVMDKHRLYQKQVDGLLVQLGSSREELHTFGITFTYRQISDRKQETDFLQKIFHSFFTPLLKQRAQQANRLLMDYFRQEELLNGERTGMVDVGWLGATRLMVNALLQEHGYPATEFFYFAVRKDVMSNQYGSYHSFFLPEQLSTELTSIIEKHFSASPYPTTIGYTRLADKRVVPLFPDGQTVAGTPVSAVNVKVATWIASNLIKSFNPLPQGALFLWAKLSMDRLHRLDAVIDCTPLLYTCMPRLSVCEVVKRSFSGKYMHRISLRLSCCMMLEALLLPIYQCTSRFRRFLYQTIILKWNY